MGRHLVLVGGGHSHLHTLGHARGIQRRGHRITLVTPTPCQYYSGMAPGYLGGHYELNDLRFPLDEIADSSGIETIWEPVQKVEVEQNRLIMASGRALEYDIASFNIGSEIAVEIPAELARKVIPVKPIERLQEVREQIENWPAGSPCRVAVIGGGAAGVEVAGNLRRLMDRFGFDGRVVLIGGGELLKGWPATQVRRVREYFLQHGVLLHEERRVAEYRDEHLFLDDGQSLAYDLALVATGTRPPRLFRESGLSVGPEGGLSVNPFLQSVDNPRVFGSGDCIYFSTSPLPRSGAYAVKQGGVLMHNLLSALEERPLNTYSPQQQHLKILNLGDGRASLSRSPLSLFGVIPWRIKEYIDRSFMAEYKPAR